MRRTGEARDAGVTLIEVVVTLSIMSIFMAMFTTGMVQIYRSYNKVDATNAAQEQVNNVFLRLDKELRYASSIAPVTERARSSSFEFFLRRDGVPTCVQLRVRTDVGELQRRSWTQGTAVPATWTTLLTGVALVPAAQATPMPTGSATAAPPFDREEPTTAQDYQRMRLYLTTTGGGAAAKTTRLTDITFTALNTSKSTDSDPCADGRADL
jgi:prepilin-type N-terminal cleavage/methylation domain-containing protein